MRTWFVQSVYRKQATGRPSGVDRNFDPTVTLVEQRIVMFAAADADDALRQAKREARAYARETYLNAYGQRVKMRFLGALSAYELFEPLAPGIEVYSTTEVVSTAVTDDEVIDRRMGHAASNADLTRRINIAHAEFITREPAPLKPKKPAPLPRKGRRKAPVKR
jgi:hypothetical protein